MKQIIYVDSLYGNDSFSGELNAPMRTLPTGLSQLYEGGELILQNGDGSSYGSASIAKNLSIKAAYGATPKIDTITFTNAQGMVEGLFFENLSNGVVVDNPYLGSVNIKGCIFKDIETAVELKSAQYISIHRNRFINHKYGVKVLNANEACISSNVFDGGSRSIEIETIQRADLWQNTIYGSSSIITGISPDQNLRVIYVTLTAFDIGYKRLQLPGFAAQGPSGQYDVLMNVVEGPSFHYGVDYTVEAFGSLVSWNGLRLEQELSVGDMLRIMYSENEELGGGDAVRILNVGDADSRVDSNSITGKLSDIAIGVFFTTPLKIRHNNFYRTTKWWDGSTPQGSTGLQNISDNPLYRDPLNVDPLQSDFNLQYMGVSGTSPNIDAADPGRWSEIYKEMGVIKVDGHYTASFTGTRSNVAPFDRNLDYGMLHRGVTGMFGVTGDIGAFEFNQHETALGNYVAERGYDFAHPGTETGPYASLDRGYARAGTLDLYVATNLVPIQGSPTGPYSLPASGVRYGRYRSKNIELSESDLKVGEISREDIAYIYPSYPAYETGAIYVGPDVGVGITGTPENPYRTISEAVASGNKKIFVKPGFYPAFKGESGVQLIGIEENRNVEFNAEMYSNFRIGSWTGIGTFDNTSSMFTLTDDTSIVSYFQFNVDLEFKFKVTSDNDAFVGGITNGTDSVYIVLDKIGSHTVIGFRKLGSNYDNYESVTDPLPMAFTDVRARIRIYGNKFRVILSNVYFDREYGGELAGTYVNPWQAYFETTGIGTSTVSGFNILSSSYVGVTGVSNTVTKRKVFGLVGSTGLQW